MARDLVFVTVGNPGNSDAPSSTPKIKLVGIERHQLSRKKGLPRLSRLQPCLTLASSRFFTAFYASVQLVALGWVLSPAISIAKPQYGYTGDVAPEKWGSLSPEYAKCTDGSEQAPVNIVSDGAKSMTRAAALKPSYPATAGDVVTNTGTTIRVDTEGKLLIGDKEYKLLQYHFHTPSEEAINGIHYALNVHLVHQDSAGKLAVIGVNFAVGSPNPFLDSLWKALPLSSGQKAAAVLPSLESMLPKDLSYYTYTGSLTTPPCTEGVQFYILKTLETISPSQLTTFRKLYPMNARPLQSLNERVIRSSD